MHEGKSIGVPCGEDEVKMDVDITVRRSSLNGEPGTKSLDLKGRRIHLRLGNSSSGGGSGGEDSSSDEPGIHHSRLPRHRHCLPPKKYRLKESDPSSTDPPNVGTTFSYQNHEDDGKDEDPNALDEMNQEDDECSQKDNDGIQSFTSGENSDSEMGGYGDGDDGSKPDGDDAGKKIFECDVCSMKFSNGANMRRHRMRHTGVKPFECRVCQKRKDHLAEHMATHSKLLPFRCPICNKGFQRQIAMRAHFQNEHVGGSHDIVKACPLCSYKSGSMKSLRVHFYSRHGIDLDNPLPHSPSLQNASNGVNPNSPVHSNSGGGDYSELAHALGFEDRERSSDSVMIPSHFLVPQIEMSSNLPYSAHQYPLSADSSFDVSLSRSRSNNDEISSPLTVSPESDSSLNLPASSDIVVVKREVLEYEHDSPEQSSLSADEVKPKTSLGSNEEEQDVPEDLSSGRPPKSFRSSLNLVSSLLQVSPLKSLLREDWKKDGTNCSKLKGATTNGTNGKSGQLNSNGRRAGLTGHSPPSSANASDGEAITSSEGSMTSHSGHNRRDLSPLNTVHQCIYCKIIFPDITLYFLHKGCHSDSSPWRCNICGEACCNVYDFNSHLLSKSHQ